MTKSVTVATWNLSGGRLARSSGLFDYEPGENLDYFVAELTKVNPDVVCLPETHLAKEGQSGASLSSRLANKLGFSYVHDAPLHRSHIDSNYTLGIGLISKHAFEAQDVPLPQPDFPILFANGKPATPHTRWLVVAEFDGFTLATTHNWPMEVFQLSYDKEPAAGYGRSLADIYLNALPSGRPLVLAGDLNFNSPENVMPKLLNELHLKEALPQDQPTRNAGDRPDHILYSPGFRCQKSRIIPGESEHYLCYATLELEG